MPNPPEMATQASSYPRTYRMSSGYRIFFIIIGPIFIGLSFFVWYSESPEQPINLYGQIYLATMTIFLLCLGGGCLLYVFSGRPNLTLQPNSIELRGLILTRRLNRIEIRGYRIVNQGNSLYEIILEPIVDTLKPVKISSMIKRDSVLDDWLDGIPDLDHIAQEQETAELADDPDLGGNPAERLARIDRAYRIAHWLTGLTFIVLIWALVYPRPYGVVIGTLALLPWIAIAMVALWPQLYRLDAKTEFGRPMLALPLMLPGFMLMLRGVLDFNLLEWQMPVVIGGLVGVGVGAIASFADRGTPLRIGTLFLNLLIMLPYGGGVTLAVNWMFDQAPPQHFPTIVQGKNISQGSKQPTTYSVTLGAWGDRQGANDVNVSKAVFDQIGTRMRVCVKVNRGALRMSYVHIVGCPPELRGPELAGPVIHGPVAAGVAAYQKSNYAKALELLSTPATAGNSEAQFTLGLLHWEGRGTAKNGDEAMRLFRLAAVQGHARAMNVLGYSYNHGLGVAVDLDEAVLWYRKAVAVNEPRALNNLAILYSVGGGVPLDRAEARRLWLKAAKQNHGPAMNNLARMYAVGEGVKRDFGTAYFWALRAESFYNLPQDRTRMSSFIRQIRLALSNEGIDPGPIERRAAGIEPILPLNKLPPPD